ncbi:Maf-like protein [Ahrensia sp. R2A130]|uniref:Maf-like protein n=1 Tax=Ahrensia sp. R2A130 TaxID=744979 RepID=UPI0001E0AC97|nr:Maf-like protein [Ahrensia sp. R2A130]EFL89704.1 maf protein [Ahrensia sp. R2A130]
MADIVLASRSIHRAKILADAGVETRQVPSTLDERAIEAPLDEADVLPEDRAEILAEAKAVDVSEREPGALVIGCDQILSLDGEVMHKPANMEEARRRLLALSGKTHMLHSAVVLARDGETVWRHVTPCAMTMRELDPAFIGRHLAAAGKAVLSSVGAYQIESLGAQLFDEIEGDLFSIVGLPLLPLLATLRREGAIDG